MSALPNYKEIMDLIKRGMDLEAQEKIIELREAAITLKEENIALREQVKALEDKLSIEDSLVYEAPYYWLVDGDSKDGPTVNIAAIKTISS